LEDEGLRLEVYRFKKQGSRAKDRGLRYRKPLKDFKALIVKELYFIK
jgi:hypothetical protein